MKLSQIVISGAIVPRLSPAVPAGAPSVLGDDRDAVIAELLSALVGAGAVSEGIRQELYLKALERERRNTTGFGKGVAVPHVKHKSIRHSMAAIGLSAAGVDFHALDRQPVHIVFLLLSPEDRPDDHLHAMEVIFKHLGQETFRRFLRQAQTAQDVQALINEVDGAMPR